MQLIVTEKPSVARDIGAVLGCTTKRDGYIEGAGLRIVWCLGHLCELEEPKAYDAAWERWSLDVLPMVPARFKLRARAESKEQWAVLKKQLLAGDVTDVVNACDAGREGELIFRYVYELAGCRRPVSRLWVASMTETAIRQAWAARRPSASVDALADAARCRSEADWIVGMNATRGLTCLSQRAGGDQLLSVGRVQTPTLAMIVARDLEIEAFVPETYWRVDGHLSVPNAGALRARWFRHDVADEPAPRGADAGADGDGRRSEGEEEAPLVERLGSAALAEGLCAALRGGRARVSKADRKEKREQPPLLYDLTALQRRANQRFGFTADQTLSIAQELYEKKLITYPRTDARFLTGDQVPELPGILRHLAVLAPYTEVCRRLLERPIAPGKRVVNPEEVGDHHAILPTGTVPDGARMPVEHKRIYDLIARRLLAALSEDAVFDVTALVFTVEPAAPVPEGLPLPPHVRARGRVCRSEGWQAIDPPGRRADRALPLLQVGDVLPVVDAEAAEAQTRPPRPLNDASLLARMEGAGRELQDAELKRALRGAGLGTPATRAEVIKTLLRRDYIVRDGKDLRATPLGRVVVAAVPVAALKSPELTGRWEARLSAIAEGAEGRARFMADVAAWAQELVEAFRGAPPPAVAARVVDGPVVGPCPRCAAEVREHRGRYVCVAAGCGFSMWGTVAGRALSKRQVKQLLVERKTPPVKGFKSKAGKSFEAGLRLNDELKVVFDFPERPERPPARPEGLSCPTCGEGQVVCGRAAWGCSRWRDGCAWRQPLVEPDGTPVDPAAVAEALVRARPPGSVVLAGSGER